MVAQPNAGVMSHTLQVDVYALACILNECWMRRPPWGREHDHFCQIIMQVACGERAT